MPLSDAAVRNAKAREKTYRIADDRVMYLEVTPAGGKYWRLKYRFDGKEKRIAFGVYPDVSLAQARERCGEARKHLANGVDPGVLKQVGKAATENSFEAVAREWQIKFSPGWVGHHAEKIIRRLEREVFPWLGARPIGEINAPELLAVLRRIEARGALDTAHRVHQNCGKIFRYADATGRAQRDSVIASTGSP